MATTIFDSGVETLWRATDHPEWLSGGGYRTSPLRTQRTSRRVQHPSGPTPFLVVKEDLISSAQRAIREARLGIQRGYSISKFLYEDGSVCAIAASFPSQLLRLIRADDADRFNWLELKRAGYFDVACIDTIEALTALQVGYDFCCVEKDDLRFLRLRRYTDYILSKVAY